MACSTLLIFLEKKRCFLVINPSMCRFVAVTKEKLDGYNLYTLEYVHATVTLTHERRGDVEVKLTCPSGTPSVLAATRKLDEYVIIRLILFQYL